jgi:hypothetical protein
MPVRHSVIHKIDKKPDGTPAVLFLGASEQVESQARDDLMSQLNESYNATAGKGWGFFHAESGAFPLSGWLGKYLAGVSDFLKFSTIAVEHLAKLMEESNLTTGGHAPLLPLPARPDRIPGHRPGAGNRSGDHDRGTQPADDQAPRLGPHPPGRAHQPQ